MRIPPRIIAATAILAQALTPWAATAQLGSELTPEAFLSQVKSTNEGYEATGMKAEAAGDEVSAGDLVYSPAFFANVSLLDDRSQQASTFLGDRTLRNTYSTGLSQNTSWGMNATLSYNMVFSEVEGVNPAFLPNPALHTGAFRLKLTQSLWKNGFGRETRASVGAIRAGARADHHGNKFKNTMLLSQAESAYWQLSAAREMVRIQTERLERAEAMRKWSQRQVGMNLADESNLLQTQAAEQAARLDLQRAKDMERKAAATLNAYRAMDSEVVAETLLPLTRKAIVAPPESPKAPVRDDVLAAEQKMLAEESAARADAEKSKPTVDLFAEVGLGGLDPNLSETLGESVGTDFPYASVGVQVQIPLAFGARSRVVGAKEARVEAASHEYRATAFEAQVRWKDMQKQFKESSERLDVVEQLERIQRDKLDRERSNQQKGRSTTFQVIQFEQDYLQSQLARIQTLSEAMQIAIQLRTYGSEK